MHHRLVVYSDTHLDNSFTFSTSPNPFHDIFFKNAFYSASEPIEYAIRNKITHLIHGGDWFDKERISAHELAVSFLLFNKIRDNNLHLYINSGNHEIDYKEGMPSIIQSMALGNPNISCLPNNVPFQCFNIDGLNLYMVKYHPDVQFNDILDKLLSEVRYPAALVIHQNIKGIQLGKTYLPNGLSENDLGNKLRNKFKFLICGHIHHASIREDTVGFKLIIPGSTTAFDFRDEGKQKSFVSLVLNENFNIVEIKEIPISASVNFITITPDQYLPAAAYNGMFVKVQISAQDDFKSLEEKLLKQGAMRVIPELIKKDCQEVMKAYARPIDMTIENWLDMYLENLGCDNEEKKYLKNLNEELFNERK